MNYAAFRYKVAKYPFFRSNIFTHMTSNVAVLRRQVSDWVDKGYIIQLKRGVYTLRNEDRSVGLSTYFIANQLYSSSYISLETALSYYGLIPERVYAITSISSKKTQRFENSFGNFIYSHIKEEMFGGFIAKKDEFGNQFFIATPERAVIDFLYLKMRRLKKIDKNIFNLSFRLQHVDLLDKKLLKTTAAQFQGKKLDRLIELLIESIGEDDV